MKIDLTQDEILHYSRHLVLPEIGMEGQQKLKNASVLIVGTGGLGSPISMYLAAAGVGHIGLVDYDMVDLSNLQRQIVHGEKNVGKKKVFSALDRLKDLNKLIHIEPYDVIFNSSNAREIAKDYDILVDGTDNFPARYLLNDLAVLTGKPYVYGSVFRFEGQVSVFDACKGPCYRCLFPEPPQPGVVPSCVESGILGVTPGIIGTLEAAETIKLLLGIGEPLIGKLLLLDSLDMTMQTVLVDKNPACPICGKKPVITDLIDTVEFCGSPMSSDQEARLDPQYLISPCKLEEMINKGEKVTILDVRNQMETRISNLPGSILVEGGHVPELEARIQQGVTTVIICNKGLRSARAVRKLLERGYTDIKSLDGGINAWASQVDRTMWQY